MLPIKFCCSHLQEEEGRKEVNMSISSVILNNLDFNQDFSGGKEENN